MANFIFYELLPVILNMSLTACVVILCVLLARLCLKKAPKVFSYALWAVVLFRLLCPVSVNSEFSLLGLLDTPAVEATEHTTVIEYVPQAVVPTPAPQVQVPPSVTAPTVPSGGVAAIPSTGAVSNAPVGSTPSQIEEAAAQPQEIAMAIATFAWLGGILVMVTYSVISYSRLKRRLIGAVQLRENIYLADHISSPFVMGIFNPKIYLPSSLPEQEQHYIILHEQHHIRRGDHVMKVLAFVALCIHWFNPLVWLAFVLSGKDMEMSCDEAVVKKLGEEIRADYSASLLSLATGQRIIAGTPLAFGEGDTKSRIKNMLNWKQAKPAVIFLSAAAVILVLLVCVTNPKTDEPIDDEQTNEEQNEKEHPSGSLEAFLADLHGDDIAEVEWLINAENRPANTEVATLIRNAVNQGEVFREDPAEGNESIAFWYLSLRIAEKGSDWDSDDILHLYAGVNESVVEIHGGANLPDGTIWVKDEALYQLVRTGMDTPDNATIDAAALSAYQDIVDAYLAQVPYEEPIVESSRRELLGFYQVAEREDLGAKIYCINTVTIVEPAEKAPYLLAGGAYVDSQLRIHGDGESNLLVVVDGEPVGFVNWMWLELDNGLANCKSREDLIRAAQSFGGVLEMQQALPLELYTEADAGERQELGFTVNGEKMSIYTKTENPHFVAKDGKKYRLPLPCADAELRYAALENGTLDYDTKVYSYEATVGEQVRGNDGSVLTEAGTYYYAVDLNALTYTVRFLSASGETEYAPTGVVLTEISALLGDWKLDGAYTEAANGVSLQSLFGTALGQYGANLTVGSDRTISYYLGVLSGEGTWQPEGDTGRCEATVILSPDGGKKQLTFYTFRKDGDATSYLALDYGDCVLFWTQNTTSGGQSTGESVIPDTTPFADRTIERTSPLNGMFERTYETQLEMLKNIDRTDPPFFVEQTVEFETCAVLLGKSLNLDTEEGSYSNTAYILFRDGVLGKLPLPVYSNGTAVLPETVEKAQWAEELRYVVAVPGFGFYSYKVDLDSRTVSMTYLAMPTEEDVHAALMANYTPESPEGAEHLYPTEAHSILAMDYGYEDGAPVCTVYAYVHFATFEWSNGRQKWVHPSRVCPVELVFRGGAQDYWRLTDFWTVSSEDTGYESSIRKRFPTTVADWVLGEIDSDFFADLNTRVYESAAAYYAALSDLPAPKTFTPADVEFSGQTLNFKETDRMSYSERLEWVRSGAADSENRAYVSEALYAEGPGILAYICQWVGTPHLGQYVFNLRFADGSTALLPLPKEGYHPSALPDTMAFRDGKFIYEKTFAEELTMSEGETLIHLKGTYHYEVDLNAKTISLTVRQ